MLLKRFYDDKLAQASYLLGCSATGEALVIDPNRDAAQYERAAAAENLHITHVTETHIHADFVSGSRELAARTGARLLLSREGGPDWQYGFAAADNAVLIGEGDRFTVGNIRIDVMHTPGHTPEHLSFVVTDTAATEVAMGIATGDFVFAGDVGRPDLLEKAAGVTGTMEAGARQLFQSIERFRSLPDHLQLWPGHGAGSACGKSLGAIPSSTLGYERAVNWAFGIADENAFVEAVLAGQPEPPKYFGEMKRINREGPRVLGGFPQPATLGLAELEAALVRGALVVDTRPADAFAAGHIPGTISIPLNRSFTTWAGWLVPYDADFHLIAGAGGPALAEAVRDLAMIGLDRVAGSFGPEVLAEWRAAHGALESVAQVDPREAGRRLADGAVTVIDVRAPSEYAAGHLPGVANIPLGQLAERISEIPRDRPLVMQCQGGGRSSMAAALLQAEGIKNVGNLAGGFSAWQAAALPVERDAARS